MYADFYDAQGQLTPQSEVDLLEIQIPPSFCGCPCFLQEWKRSKQEWRRKSGHKITNIFKMLKGS